VTVEERIREHVDALSPAEQRVAHEVLTRPQLLAFGTVASLAKATETSGATVMRLASKLGFDGFVDLQAEVQSEMAARLGSAVDRIGAEDAEEDILSEVLRAETANIEATIRGIDRTQFDAVVRALGEARRHIWVASGDCVRGAATSMVDQLFALRPDVTHVDGNQLQVGRMAGAIRADDVLVVMDFARYDRTVVELCAIADEQKAWVVAVTDSPLSPLAKHARTTFVISRLGVGPFDSAAATTVLCQTLVAATARAGRRTAAPRLVRTESAWQALGALTDPR
jgi:DNA-binding MurR/RpiR family transcriptional regulator